MTLTQYLNHYFVVKDMLLMLCVSATLFMIMHFVISLFSKAVGGNTVARFEIFYEMIISSTAMLFFIGLYFLVEYRYFNVADKFYKIWSKYDDFLLLLALLIAVFFMNLLDRVLIPLRTISRERRGTLRMMAMVYMLVIFAYIKFIYEDNNYDGIINYFIIMMLGRYIYFDASVGDFFSNLRDMLYLSPILVLALISTGAMAFYGFNSGYLLKSNGVVGSLCIAHLFFTFEVFIAHIIQRLMKKV